MTTDTPPDEPHRDAPPPGEDPAALLGVGLSGPSGTGRAPAPPAESLAAQFPAFEVLEVLGQGGMGVVYKARQRRLDRIVALKVLPRALSEDPAFTERFAREGRTLARLQHPHIVGVHDIGEADGQSYLVMEYVDGVTLRALMDAGELTAKEALTIVPQICDALQYAHDEGVVHRDIKPENVLLDRSGSVKVADFGLAKLAERAPGDFTLTGTDQIMGTLHYMAPEQYKTPQDVDHRADIFSLGVVFYEMLTGELPVGRFDEPSKSGELDTRIDEIVMRTLERERDQRYQNAREVRTAVTTFADGGRVAGEQPPRRREGDEGEPARHAAPPALTRERPLPGPRPLSRWFVTALVFVFVAPVLGGLAYILYGALAGTEKDRVLRGVIGWLFMLGGLGLAGFFSTIAIIVTQVYRARVRGQFASIALLVGCLAAMIGCVFGANAAMHDANRAWHRIHDLTRPSEVVVHGARSHSEGVAVRDAIETTLAEFASVVDYNGLRPEGLTLRRLYAADDLETLAALSGDEADKKRAAGVYGLGLWTRHVALLDWRHFKLRYIRVDEAGDAAIVRVVWHPTKGGAGGAFRGRGRTPPKSVTFPMKRASHGWVFAVGPVEFE